MIFGCADKSKRKTGQLHICIRMRASSVVATEQINENSVIRDCSKSGLYK